MTDLVVLGPQGLYCPQADFHIDPWQAVEYAVITHAHSDHAIPGSSHYLAAKSSEKLLRKRLGDISLETLKYGEAIFRKGVRISLHPAGHVLGSAQVRLEYNSQVWVVSGDYKREDDPTCEPFEPQHCNTFITESTFGLPLYRWEDRPFDEINQWWRLNAEQGRPSVIFVYALGKAQRILSGLDISIGAVLCHGAVSAINDVYRSEGVVLPQTKTVEDGRKYDTALILAPPSAQSSAWLRRFSNYSDGYASGWMRLRGARRRRGVDRGFVLSDHADWPALLRTINETGAERVIVTHGYASVLARYLKEQGLQASAWETRYMDEPADTATDQAGTEIPI